MIFVTVGHKEFDRLVKSIDEIAKRINDELVIQIGDRPKYFPKNAKYFRFITRNEIEEYFRNTKLIISQCSTGAIINARRYSKPIIMIPRDHRRGEHIDGHQLQLAKILEGDKSMKGVYILYDLSQLEPIIQLALKVTPKYTESSNKQRLINTIRDFINRNFS